MRHMADRSDSVNILQHPSNNTFVAGPSLLLLRSDVLKS